MLPLCSAVSLTLPLGSATRQVRGAGATFWKALPGPVLGDTPRQKVLTSVLPWRGAGGRCQLFWACVLAADAGSFPWCPPGRGLRPSERKSEEGSRLWVGDWPGGPSEVPPGPRFSEKSPVPGSLIPLQAPPPPISLAELSAPTSLRLVLGLFSAASWKEPGPSLFYILSNI